jgi:hypothetical protein
VVAPLVVSPTGGLPATVRPAANHLIKIGAPAAAGVFYADAGPAMTGGVVSTASMIFTANERARIDLAAPFLVAPGFSVALFIPPAAMTAALDVMWWEDEL